MRQLLLFIILIAYFQCFSQKETELNCDVRPATSKLLIDGHQVFYALPKNNIRLEVEVKKTVQYVGPYNEFAEKYLNITEGIIRADNEYYAIVDVKFHRISIPDSNQFYSVNCSGINFFPVLQLNNDGVILGCNSTNELEGYATNNNVLVLPELDFPEFEFTDLGIKPFLVEKTETQFKIVHTDTTPAKVAVTQAKMVPTTVEYNAQEAADFIRKLRKRRMKLVIGDKDETLAVDGAAIKEMINELNKYEQKYLELFMGKTIEKTYTYYFDFDPDEESDAEQQIVGWFSPNKGVRPNKPDFRRSDYQPLIVKAVTLGKVPDKQIQMMDQAQKTPTPIKYGLYYRIPGRMHVSLIFNDLILAKQQMVIAQKGEVIPLPVWYINNPGYSIEYYSETGALKRIYTKTDH